MLSVDGVRMTTQQIETKIADQYELNKQRPKDKQIPVLVDGDENATYKSVLEAMALATAAGFKDVTLVTKSKSTKASGK